MSQGNIILLCCFATDEFVCGANNGPTRKMKKKKHETLLRCQCNDELCTHKSMIVVICVYGSQQQYQLFEKSTIQPFILAVWFFFPTSDILSSLSSFFVASLSFIAQR